MHTAPGELAPGSRYQRSPTGGGGHLLQLDNGCDFPLPIPLCVWRFAPAHTTRFPAERDQVPMACIGRLRL